MPKVAVCDMTGKKVGDIELSERVFASEPNIGLMHQAVVCEQANARQGTHDVKTRSEVKGGGAKPYRQKGTGRARQGTIRAPHYYHGGVVFGPTPRSYSKALPKKMRRAALRSALSSRVTDGDIIVVDNLSMDEISTKKMVGVLKSIGCEKKAVVITDESTKELKLSSRNIQGVNLREAPAFSVRDVLNADKVVMTKGAVAKVEEVFN